MPVEPVTGFDGLHTDNLMVSLGPAVADEDDIVIADHVAVTETVGSHVGGLITVIGVLDECREAWR